MSNFKSTNTSIYISPLLNERTIPAGTAAPNGKTYKKRRKSYNAVPDYQIMLLGISPIDLYTNDRVLIGSIGSIEYTVISFDQKTRSAQLVSLGYITDQISIKTEMPIVLTSRELSESSKAPF